MLGQEDGGVALAEMDAEPTRKFRAFALLVAEDELRLDAERPRSAAQPAFVNAVNEDADGASCRCGQLPLVGRDAENEQAPGQTAGAAMTRQLQLAQRSKQVFSFRFHERICQ
jgi:hypothetical protein